MNKNIKVKVGNYASLEEFSQLDTSNCVLSVKIRSVLSAYKGSSQMDEDKVDRMAKGFVDRGYIKLREQERILFGTGIILEIPEGIQGNITTHPNISIFKGLRVIGPNLMLTPHNELCVMVHNDSLHLCQVDFEEEVAVVTFSPILNLDFKIEM